MDHVDVPPVESYKQLKERLAVEQAGKTKEDILLETRGIDLDSLPEQAKARADKEHRWVKRGLKMSCEGYNHPHHSHFLIG